MGEKKKRSQNALIAVIVAVVLAIGAYTVEINGRTGWDRMKTLMGMAPARTTPVYRGGWTSTPPAKSRYQSRPNTQTGTPEIKDSARGAKPLAPHSKTEQKALDQLINKVK